MNTTLGIAAEMMQGTLHGADRSFTGVSTDTRSLARDELFIALNGPNFRGLDFVANARQQGAAAAVVDKAGNDDIAQIEVNDTRLALGRLGSAWRQQSSATVIGITGSNGKTTLKELCAACLSQAAPTLATQGNLNNDIGMPLMLTRIDAGHRYAVLEMGANHAGEIAYLAGLAKSDVVAITNAGAAHLEGFGSVEGVARAKGEILDSAGSLDAAILNADDSYFDYWKTRVGAVRTIGFGLSDAADVRADGIEARPDGCHFSLHLPATSLSVSLRLAGIHNVRNACAAAAISVALDLTAEQIKAGLESVQPVQGRLQALAGRNGATVYDDSYNANPLSVVAAGEFLANLSGQSWFVLGDMGELGSDELAMHKDTGLALRRAGVDKLFATGELAQAAVDGFGAGGRWFADAEALSAAVAPLLETGINVLVKGSRFMRMERVVEQFRDKRSPSKEA